MHKQCSTLFPTLPWPAHPRHELCCSGCTCAAGTEDGHIHKCSTSYSEQYLESYTGHIGPVYALQWSPFNPNLFVSCSGDWTIRLWQQGKQQQLLSFQSSNEEVLDVQWCPSNSTVFGAVTAGGRLELWDFAVSTMRPVVQHVMTKCSMTSLLFAKVGCAWNSVHHENHAQQHHCMRQPHFLVHM